MKKLKEGIVSLLDKLDQGLSWTVGAVLPKKVQKFCAEKRVLLCGIGVAAAAVSLFYVGPLVTLKIIAGSFCMNMTAAYCKENIEKRAQSGNEQPARSAQASAVERSGFKQGALAPDFTVAHKNKGPQAQVNKAIPAQGNKPAQKNNL